MNEATKLIESMAPVFATATMRFEEFHQQAGDKSSGDSSQSASSGHYSQSASSGERSAASALGYRAAVMGDMGNLLMCSEYAKVDGVLTPIGGLCGIVDGKILKPGRWYIVEGGAWTEVDFTDGIFSYVLSTRQGVKKVRTDNGDVLFIVGDGNGNFAHGKTIKEAKEDLVFKVAAKWDGKIPESATGAEWIGLSRAITRACSEGCKQFVKGKNLDLSATYTAQQVAELVAGWYGAEKFAAAMKGSK